MKNIPIKADYFFEVRDEKQHVIHYGFILKAKTTKGKEFWGTVSFTPFLSSVWGKGRLYEKLEDAIASLRENEIKDAEPYILSDDQPVKCDFFFDCSDNKYALYGYIAEVAKSPHLKDTWKLKQTWGAVCYHMAFVVGGETPDEALENLKVQVANYIKTIEGKPA